MKRLKKLISGIIQTITIDQLVGFYRYLSTIAISIFFIVFTEDRTNMKYGIPILICISSVLLNYLYSNNRDNKKYMLFLLFMETVNSSIIIFNTGGTSSPFIWYTFNSILVGFIIIDSIKYTVICALAYVSSITFSSIILHQGTIVSNANIILCLILITGLIYILYQCMHDLCTKNVEVENVNSQIADTMKHILELYDTMHVFTVSNNKDDIINISLAHISAIVNSKNSGFLTYTNKELKYEVINGQIDDDITAYIKDNFSTITNSNDITQYRLNEKLYYICPILRNVNLFGVLIFELESEKNDHIGHITYICELTSITLEKSLLEKINSDLLINSEQNRIATEIHDSVLQSLFSITCYVYTLIKKKSMDGTNEITIEHLNSIRNSIISSISDLKDIIYSLSLYKNGKNIFIEDIHEKIEEIMDYSEISIDLEVEADTERLSFIQKKSLYKIICELLHNSVKHSGAKEINMKIYIDNTDLVFIFRDNGIGFDYKKTVANDKMGLGLKNIQYLIGIMHGSYTFKSSESQGIVFETSIPL